MAKQNEALFEESSQGAVSAVTAFAFVVSVVLFFGGILLSSYAFELGHDEALIFGAGLLATCLGAIIPFAWLPAIGK